MRRILLTLFLALGAGPASATTLAPVDFAQLVTGARAVVYGRITDVRTVRDDGRRTVETHVTLEARDYYKGNLGPIVTFMVPGGALGRYRTVYVGAPRFRAGDDVVLFLNAQGPALPWVSGLSQGVFRVRRTDQGEPLVTPPPLDAHVTTGTASAIVRGDPARRPLPLAAFARAVRAVAEHPR